jgi:hypothetical protein
MPALRGRPRLIRAATISLARVSVTEQRAARETPTEEHRRPVTRADCAPARAGEEGGEFSHRPCPYVACKHHLFLDVSDAGSIKLNFPDIDAEQLSKLDETCALDVAEQGGKTLEEVGVLLNLTRERVRQVEEMSTRALRRKPFRLRLLGE